MRDPERIERILKLIKYLWWKVPDWRLGQLLVNVTGWKGDMFHLEDDKLEEALQDVVNDIQSGDKE